MCIAININPKAKFITLRIGRRVLVCDWLKLTPLFSTHKLEKASWWEGKDQKHG